MAELKKDSTSFLLLQILWVLLQASQLPVGRRSCFDSYVSVTVPSTGLWSKSHKALGMEGRGCVLLPLLLWLPCDRRITFTRGWSPELKCRQTGPQCPSPVGFELPNAFFWQRLVFPGPGQLSSGSWPQALSLATNKGQDLEPMSCSLCPTQSAALPLLASKWDPD